MYIFLVSENGKYNCPRNNLHWFEKPPIRIKKRKSKTKKKSSSFNHGQQNLNYNDFIDSIQELKDDELFITMK